MFSHRSTQHRSACFHPSGWTPGSGKQEDFRIDGLSDTQDGQNVFSIVGYAESLEFGIGIGPIIETVGGARVVAGTNAGTSYGQPQSVRPEQFGQQFLARVRF